MSPKLFTPNAALWVSPAMGGRSTKSYPSPLGYQAAACEPTEAMLTELTAPTMIPFGLTAYASELTQGAGSGSTRIG